MDLAGRMNCAPGWAVRLPVFRPRSKLWRPALGVGWGLLGMRASGDGDLRRHGAGRGKERAELRGLEGRQATPTEVAVDLQVRMKTFISAPSFAKASTRVQTSRVGKRRPHPTQDVDPDRGIGCEAVRGRCTVGCYRLARRWSALGYPRGNGFDFGSSGHGAENPRLLVEVSVLRPMVSGWARVTRGCGGRA